MFDWDWIDELDADAAADELARARELVVAAEAGQFLLAAHWADLHAGAFVDGCRSELPGMPRLASVADGCPQIEEYAAAELAALLGRSTFSGEQMIRDAVAVRHRHRQLWAELRQGSAPVWLAAKVARRCVAARLDAAQAAWVDEQTTPYLSTLPPRRFLDLVEAKIIEADPEAAEERARARALARFVRAGRTDEDGLRTLVARAHAGDITYLVAVLDRIAVVLVEQGDPRPHDVLRADALRILGNPARALALLTGATLDHADPAVETPGEATAETLFPHGDTGWMLDARGRTIPGVLDISDLDVDEPDLDSLVGSDAVSSRAAVGSELASPGEVATDAALLSALLAALRGFDASRLDPVTVLHVHLSEAALAARAGVARIEELGPAVLGEVRDWLTHPFSPEQVRQQVRVRPVLDVDAVVPVDRYEVSDQMREAGTVRTPYEVFPYGTLPSRKADDDHVVAFQHGTSNRVPPPGQTRLDNLAKLARFHHRLKTNGGWFLTHPEPGAYWWRTPHGHWFCVDAAGTHHHGRDPALDERWLQEGKPAA